MSKQAREFLRSFRKHFKKMSRLQTGFTMLEAVVVVGVLLAVAAGGFLSYGPITANSKTAAVRTAASSVYTAILVAQSDGDPSTSATEVVDDFNSSNDKLKAEIREAGTEADVAAMTTAGYTPKSDNDFCLRVTNLEAPSIFAEMGNCQVDSIPIEPEPTQSPSTEPTPTPTTTASTTNYAASWGYNNDGQLGNGNTTDSSVPVAITTTGILAGKAITSFSGGHRYTCVIADDKPYCWGLNDLGQLGNNTTTNSSAPVAVITTGGLSDKTITSLSSGIAHTCAVADGKAYCWGSNTHGQLGNNKTTNSSTPVDVNTNGSLAGKTITSISAGYYHTCAVADGKPYCWGWNAFGQLGNNTVTSSSVPVAVTTTGVLSGKTITSLSNGNNHTCVVADGKPYCWGHNDTGKLGNNTTTNSSIPVAVTTTGVLAGKTVTALSSGGSHTCVIASGELYCWGYNAQGQLGNNTTTNSSIPVAGATGVLSGKTITALSAGAYHTCVIADKDAYCGGYNNSGQLGNGNTTNSSIPVAVTTTGVLAGKTITAISAGSHHTLVIYN